MRKLSFRLNLRNKLIIALVGLAVFPFVSAMLITIVRLQDTQREIVVSQNRQVAQIASEEIEGFIISQFTVLKNIGLAYPEFSKDQVLRNSLLERFLHRGGEFVELAITDESGKEISRSHVIDVVTPAQLRNRGETKEFLEAQAHEVYLGPVYVLRGKVFFDLGVRISGVDGTFRGVVFAQVDAAIMQNVVRRVSAPGEKGRTYIVNSEGVVIAHSDISQVLAKTSFSHIPAVKAVIRGSQIGSLSKPYRNTEGDKVLGAGVPIVVSFPGKRSVDLSTNWFVIVEQPASDALRVVTQITQFSFILLLAIVLLAALAAFFFATRIMRPVNELHKGVEIIESGNLGYRVHVHTNDEIQELAEAFNRMIEGIEKAQERDQGVSRMKSEFLSIAAHQLRTPLSALKWVLSLLLEGDLGKLKKGQKELLQKGYDTNDRMIALVTDLLDVVRIEEGRFDYKLEKGAVAEIVEDVVEEIKVIAEQKGVQFFFHKPSRKLPGVVLDPVKFRLAVANVIDNAVQYTRANGRVDIEIALKGDEILISVKDTGIGIASHQLSRLFTKFFRADNAVRMQTSGSGLGLFITKNVIEKHGGKIWIESIEGKGTTVYFTVPVAERKRL